ncbi:MAG: CoA transferase [Clostridia bacterium]|nr:CoA transferase [Clostridia bacterium]
MVSGNAWKELMRIRGCDVADGEVKIQKSAPLYKTPFKMGEVSAEILAAKAVAANDIWELKTGKRQNIFVEEKYAAAVSLQGTGQTQVKKNGVYEPIPDAPDFAHMVSITQPWETKDGKYFLPHFNLPHLKKRVLDVLQCEDSVEGVSQAVKQWNAKDLDKAVAEANASGGIVYTQEEWLKHPHGKLLAEKPVVEIVKIGESEPEEIPAGGNQPLSGIHVLDMTRILAGPTCGLGLTEHGADDLMVTAPSLPQIDAFVRDTSHGKRSCYLDYTDERQAEILKNLLRDADIFIEGYRPGSMKKHGFAPQDVMKLRPGIICVSVNCFGDEGVYGDRAGWDQVAQAVTGMCATQGRANGTNVPALTPVFVCDFLTGLLGSYGAMLALARRAKEGGSYHVKVSLCKSAMLLQRQGLRDDYANAPGRLKDEELEKYAVYDNGTIYGDLRTLGPVVSMSETMPKWNGTTPQLGSSEPVWK